MPADLFVRFNSDSLQRLDDDIKKLKAKLSSAQLLEIEHRINLAKVETFLTTYNVANSELTKCYQLQMLTQSVPYEADLMRRVQSITIKCSKCDNAPSVDEVECALSLLSSININDIKHSALKWDEVEYNHLIYHITQLTTEYDRLNMYIRQPPQPTGARPVSCELPYNIGESNVNNELSETEAVEMFEANKNFDTQLVSKWNPDEYSRLEKIVVGISHLTHMEYPQAIQSALDIDITLLNELLVKIAPLKKRNYVPFSNNAEQLYVEAEEKLKTAQRWVEISNYSREIVNNLRPEPDCIGCKHAINLLSGSAKQQHLVDEATILFDNIADTLFSYLTDEITTIRGRIEEQKSTLSEAVRTMEVNNRRVNSIKLATDRFAAMKECKKHNDKYLSFTMASKKLEYINYLARQDIIKWQIYDAEMAKYQAEYTQLNSIQASLDASNAKLEKWKKAKEITTF